MFFNQPRPTNYDVVYMDEIGNYYLKRDENLAGFLDVFKSIGKAVIGTVLPSVGGILNNLGGGDGGAALQQAQQMAQQAVQAVEQIKSQCAALPAGEVRFSQRDAFRSKAQQVIDAIEQATGQLKSEKERNVLRAAKQKCWDLVGDMNKLIDTPGATPESNDMIFDSSTGITGGASGGVNTTTILLVAAAIGGIWLMKS